MKTGQYYTINDKGKDSRFINWPCNHKSDCSGENTDNSVYSWMRTQGTTQGTTTGTWLSMFCRDVS